MIDTFKTKSLYTSVNVWFHRRTVTHTRTCDITRNSHTHITVTLYTHNLIPNDFLKLDFTDITIHSLNKPLTNKATNDSLFIHSYVDRLKYQSIMYNNDIKHVMLLMHIVFTFLTVVRERERLLVQQLGGGGGEKKKKGSRHETLIWLIYFLNKYEYIPSKL